MPVIGKKSTPKGNAKLRANEQKWGAPLVNAGWTMLPSTILEYQHVLKLDPVELNVLLQLASYWWIENKPPHPKIATIAERIGRSRSTVQRCVIKLQKRGLIRIEHRTRPDRGRTSSAYYFDGLIKKATAYAQEILTERDANRLTTDRRRARAAAGQGPKLSVVKGDE